MFKNYLTSAIRSFLKNKTTFLINIIGLSLASAICIIIITYVLAEFKYDKFHANYDRLYRLTGVLKDSKEEFVNHPAKYYDHLEDFPEIDKVCRFYSWDNCSVKKNKEIFYEKEIFLTDSSFFNLFSFNLISGDSKDVLSAPNQLIISQKISKKLFGSENPVNQSITINSEHIFIIKGVFENFPESSSLNFDYIGSIYSLKNIENEILENWNYAYIYYYILLKKNSTTIKIEQKFHEFIRKYRGEHVASVINFKLDQFKKAHLWSGKIQKDIITKGNIINVYGFSVIAMLIIALACFNFINLSLSSFINRSKEIGLRKSLGAQRINIIVQFNFETLLVVLTATSFSIILIKFGINYFNEITNLKISFSWLNINNVIYLILIIILLTFGSGFYPSHVLSRLSVASLNRRSNNSTKIIDYYFKQIPIILQFTIAISLIISTILVLMQIEYMDQKKLGFNQRNLICIKNPYDANMFNRYEYFFEKVSRYPEVEEVSGSYDVPPNGYSMSLKFFLENQNTEDAIQLAYIPVEHGFLSVIEANFIEGRNFESDKSSDSTAVIITKSVLASLRTNAKEILINGINRVTEDGSVHLSVIGIIDDIHFSSLKYSFEPMLFKLSDWGKSNIIIRTKTDNSKEIIAKLNKDWLGFTSDWPFIYSFVSDNIDALYRTDKNLGYVLKFIAFIAIFISLLGIIAFSSFLASKRKKEIGIRKVIGASKLNILILLVNKFVRWILFSFIVSCPIVYFLIKEWLKNFYYRITIEISVFIFSGFLILCVGITVVLIVSYKYASINPTETIKDFA